MKIPEGIKTRNDKKISSRNDFRIKTFVWLDNLIQQRVSNFSVRMRYHVTFDPKHLSTSEWCQSVTYGQCVTCFESRHVTSDPTTREP